ncbi:hypothetical protein PR202_gb27498 [Eleusine coracana subsp. coracana]|uniref:Reverse transcriptase zinc-binding domain-containing protein n=1 Tax=Eleusine coracana subsp. coracana TaxID=191504 RepID=A0AAV5FS04_ELECO|nr:hypothetical protein PR202_gb27498 [Eleusine coracana subsp. coracana]
MVLDSYSCELCILQREETLHHLFIRCNFVVACWETIGITYPRTWDSESSNTSGKNEIVHSS